MRDKRQVMGKAAGKGTGGRSGVQVLCLRPFRLSPPPLPPSLLATHSLLPPRCSLPRTLPHRVLESRSLFSFVALRIKATSIVVPHNQTHLFLVPRNLCSFVCHSSFAIAQLCPCLSEVLFPVPPSTCPFPRDRDAASSSSTSPDPSRLGLNTYCAQ